MFRKHRQYRVLHIFVLFLDGLSKMVYKRETLQKTVNPITGHNADWGGGWAGEFKLINEL